MRLPFSSRNNKAQDGTVEAAAASTSRRSSVSEDGDTTGLKTANNDDLLSERSSSAHNSSLTDTTPATSFSSYGSGNGHNGEKSGMYKLSVVDNSGTFLPPSPTDESRSKGNKAWSLHRKQNNKSRERVASAEGPFIISRESFEGYRRSFDIGGTSPTIAASPTFPNSPRLSLDSSVSTRAGSISSRTGSKLRVLNIPKVEETVAVAEAPFEDIKLEDEDKTSRKTILSRFGFGQKGSFPTKKRDGAGEELQSLKIDK